MKIEELIARCIRREPSAEKQLYYRYAKSLFGTCRRYAQDDQRAEDYMQDTFEKIFTNLSKYDGEKGAFESWISRIAINVIFSDKRKKRAGDRYQEIDDHISHSLMMEIDDEVLQSDLSEQELLTAIRKLPNGHRDVVNLYVFESWSHKQISTMLGIKESSSRSRFTRAKQMLKSFLLEKIPVL